MDPHHPHSPQYAVAHVGLTVPDIDDAIDWFRRALMWPLLLREPVTTVDGAAIGLPGDRVRRETATLDAGSAYLELAQYHAPEPGPPPADVRLPGYSHLALQPFDLGVDWKRLTRFEVEWWGEPQELSIGGNARHNSVSGRGPFGNVLTLYSHPGRQVRPTGRPALDGVALTVPDLDRSVEWCRHVFGWPVVWSEAGEIDGSRLGLARVPTVSRRTATLDTGTAYMQLQSFGDAPPSEPRRICDLGITHVGLSAPDIHAAYGTLRARGIDFDAHPTHVTTGERAGESWTFGRDCDDNVIQLVTRPPLRTSHRAGGRSHRPRSI